ncbi:DUF3465 domain-containing protein [Woeseia oceani]|uniref:DUF3465 domain-containing protein n=1 Tax=Woeseia oceani TaxID=1548547 RepID=A0A193LBM4_9GAMM|nr:DUF3465 domain-containing protein [Woeseia oceani]ANO49930.1 hypothetical protein BA177_00695 [Woeseia oceani]
MKRQFGKQDSGLWVEGIGTVCRLLPDDKDGDHHQRLILDMRNGTTLLLVHNIEIAEKVPLGVGDRIRFRGVYEWNDLGGLVHWTHTDPFQIEKGGYIRYRTRDYC